MISDAPLKILVAEDDDAAAHLIKANLKRTGIDAQFFRAADGEEALTFIESSGNGELDGSERLIILLDIRMPKKDGIQVLEILKGNSLTKKIPIVMLTTSDRPIEVDTCYRLGCSFYLKKQVDYSKFVDGINKLAQFIQICEIPIWGEITDG
jgi:CheY-like chemotaxis protein